MIKCCPKCGAEEVKSIFYDEEGTREIYLCPICLEHRREVVLSKCADPTPRDADGVCGVSGDTLFECTRCGGFHWQSLAPIRNCECGMGKLVVCRKCQKTSWIEKEE